MVKRLFTMLAALLFVAGAVPTAWAELANLGIPIAPHGYPAFYTDTAGLALEPCLPANQFGTAPDGVTQIPVGNSTRPDLCIFDPIDPNNPDSVKLGVGDESFWWMSDAVMNMPGDGRAVLVLGLEGAFGGVGSVADGQQIAFGRIRIRVDTPTAGLYTVTHPFGSETFNVTDPAEGINVTSDIGSINQLTPALGFGGALASDLGPFLTWPNYLNDETLKVRALDPVTGLPDPNGVVLEQYIGNPNIPHTVTGGPNGNIFRVQGPNGLDVQTALFTVMGKIYDPSVIREAHIFPDVPLPNLFAAGPVNRPATVDLAPIVPPPPTTAPGVTGVDNTPYPVGYPIWYQDNVGTVEAPVGGLQLTYCPPTDAMCISAPIDTVDPNSVALRVGEESFYWTSEAFINEDTADVNNLPAGLDGILVMAIEGAFGGVGTPAEQQQIAFARIRIRVDVPTPGTYTITYPYGQEVFENVTVDDGINMTRDIMISDPANPDSAFIGAIYGDIGPQFLTWPDYTSRDAAFLLANPEYTALQKLSDPTNPLSPVIQYIGDPAVEHAVTGSPTENNFFRIEGPDGIDVQTSLFAVTGKVYDPETFNLGVNAALPVANADSADLNLVNAASVIIPVLNNDTEPGAVPATAANVTAAIVTQPAGGTVVVNANDTVTYTPGAALAAAGGTDTFTYNITMNANPLLVSNNAEVTVTVIPVETIAVRKARLDLRRLQFDIQGTSNIDGTTLTIYPGTAPTGTPIGTANVAGGRWSLRTTATRNPNVTSITVTNLATGASLTAPLQVR